MSISSIFMKRNSIWMSYMIIYWSLHRFSVVFFLENKENENYVTLNEGIIKNEDFSKFTVVLWKAEVHYLVHKSAIFPIPSQMKPVCTHQISLLLLFHLNYMYWFIFVCGKTLIKSPFFVISKH